MNRAQEVADILKEKGIPFEKTEMSNGIQVAYPGHKKRVCSIIDHDNSYGLEIMGLLTDEELEHDSVAGNLKIDDVVKRVEKHFNDNKKDEDEKNSH